MAVEEEREGDVSKDSPRWKRDRIGVIEQAEEEEEGIIELVASIQQAGGNARGKRVYFSGKSMEELREKCGDDFFLFTERTLLVFVEPHKKKITLTALKGVYKNYL